MLKLSLIKKNKNRRHETSSLTAFGRNRCLLKKFILKIKSSWEYLIYKIFSSFIINIVHFFTCNIQNLFSLSYKKFKAEY